jgi:hypothetical protein
LNNLIIQISFERKEEPIFVATTFAGCVGVFTGMRLKSSGPFGLGLNYRYGVLCLVMHINF